MGQNFRVFEGSAVVSEAVSCQVTVQGNMESSQTKDSASNYNQEQMMSRSWSVQVDTYDVSVATLRKYIGAFNVQGEMGSSGATGMPIGWDETAGENNAVAQSAAFARAGLAYLSDFSLQASNRQTAQLSMQFSGNGGIQ